MQLESFRFFVLFNQSGLNWFYWKCIFVCFSFYTLFESRFKKSHSKIIVSEASNIQINFPRNFAAKIELLGSKNSSETFLGYFQSVCILCGETICAGGLFSAANFSIQKLTTELRGYNNHKNNSNLQACPCHHTFGRKQKLSRKSSISWEIVWSRRIMEAEREDNTAEN